MRLILQPKSTKKDVASYSQLLKRVLQIRLLYLYRLYALASLPLLFYSKRGAFAVFLICGLVALYRKDGIHTSRIMGRTLAETIKDRLVSFRTLRCWLILGASTAIYYVTFFGLKTPLFTVELHAGLQKNSQGLAHAFKAGVLNHSLVYLNENIVYNLYFASYVTALYTLRQTVSDEDLLVPSAAEVPPQNALFQNLGEWKHQTLQFLATFAAFPVLYVVLHPVLVAPFYAIPMSGYVISSTTRPSLWGVLFTYPLKWAGLVVVWRLAEKAFSAYMNRGPVHAGKTVSEESQDPNATLVTGLTAKRSTLTRLEAWLELAVIGQRFAKRRVSIYSDLGSDKPMWKQIFATFVEFNGQIQSGLKELLPATPHHELVEVEPHKHKVDSRTIKLSGAQAVLTAQPTAIENFALKYQRKATDIQLRQSLSEKAAESFAALKSEFINSKWGASFKPSEMRKLSIAAPDLTVFTYAIEGVATLIVHSYDEDDMGYVQADIGAALEIFDSLIDLVGQIHSKTELRVPELEATALEAFTIVWAQFSQYFENLKISQRVLERAAKLQ